MNLYNCTTVFSVTYNRRTENMASLKLTLLEVTPSSQTEEIPDCRQFLSPTFNSCLTTEGYTEIQKNLTRILKI